MLKFWFGARSLDSFPPELYRAALNLEPHALIRYVLQCQ